VAYWCRSFSTLCVCRSVSVNCGKMADWMWMPFGVMDQVNHIPDGWGC